MFVIIIVALGVAEEVRPLAELEAPPRTCMYMCIYIYIYIHIYIYIYTHIQYIYIYIYTHKWLVSNIVEHKTQVGCCLPLDVSSNLAELEAPPRTCVYIYIYIHIHICISWLIHTHVCMYIYIYIHTYIKQICVYIYIYIHTYICI